MGVRKTIAVLGLLLCVSWCSILEQHMQDPLRDSEPGHNDEVSAESREPSTNFYKEADAKFVLVLDNSGSMSSCNRMENLKYILKRWVDGLKINTKVAIVKFGSGNECVTGSMQLAKDCYVTVSGVEQSNELKRAIDGMEANMGENYMAEALKSALPIMIEDHDAHGGQPGVVMLVTDGVSRDDVSDHDVWKPFQLKRIRVITLNLGAEIDTRMEALLTETGGRAFVSAVCGTVENDAFQYATQTFIPGNVGDNAIEQQVTHTETVTGLHSMGCAATNDGKPCFKASFTIEKSLNKEVTIEALLYTQGAPPPNAKEVVDKMDVRKQDGSEVEGWEISFSAEYPNYVQLSFPGYVPDVYTEQLLDVYLTPNMTVLDFARTTAVLTFKGKRNFADEEDANYWVSCDHPSIMKPDEPFLIKSRVMRGTTPVNYANVVAKVTVSRADDPYGDLLPRFFQLKDDGSEGTNSGDETKNDGTYSVIVSPIDLQADDGFGISVKCNLLESSDAEWNDNNFWGH